MSIDLKSIEPTEKGIIVTYTADSKSEAKAYGNPNTDQTQHLKSKEIIKGEDNTYDVIFKMEYL